MGSVSTAVGCAVGIPIGLGLLVALFFWWRLQRRFKREDKEDAELEQVIQDDNGYISFDNLETLQQQEYKEPTIWQNQDAPQSNDSEIFEVRKIPRQPIGGSGSSDGSVSQEEKNTHVTGSLENLGPSQHQEPSSKQQRKSKYFVPAYRRKLNAIQSKQVNADGISTSNSSNASLESSQKLFKKHINIYDQMIPVVAGEPSAISDDKSDKDFPQNNELLIKNLKSQDFGSYPTRASSASLNQLNMVDPSNSSIKQTASVENVFDTPKSERVLNSDEKLEKPDDVYLLRNNYDIMNTSEIAEEDQYENEFTNYTENKREFIDSLRPKKK
ncbi:hypothetical protein HG535_0F06170 [Zygotorulaspora mrakii]|uniref:Suppressor of lethality of KEX2 GAS1 double null mutant protein 1 n=1 Tax=Zygotorulaspora mrakii TaxID=42260 RepID=A0A7H9B5X0_ZYGMR|nr:uncharacterized protein HG535_0F06170 [Zygotorulaspora mrakii]QLG74105.1 hypothetical protein HG535_0F06170 [Zygotorulaspora mrakii]